MKISQKLFRRFSVNCELSAFSLLLLLLTTTGCQPERSPKPEMTMQVKPTGQPGTYMVSGRTSLPDRSKITVQAVRRLKEAKASPQNQAPDFTILAKNQATVKSGQWQASLNLHQVLPDGQSMELWQLNEVRLALQPDAQVQFVAVTEPDKQEFDQLPSDQDPFSVRFTPDGKSFLQIEQSLTVEPPSVKPANAAPATPIKSVPTKPAEASPNVQRPSDTALPERAVAR